MAYFITLAVALVVVVVAAVVVQRRRAPLGGDAREDRFENPGRDRFQSWTDKHSGHGGTSA